jgi:hypothetical protein
MLGLFISHAVAANPCADKLWIDAPILALNSLERTSPTSASGGIGGSGHAAGGIGGSGHTSDDGGPGTTTQTDTGGIGGSGHTAGGIGGSGLAGEDLGGSETAARTDSGGIGGSGLSAGGIGGSGFIGVISGFGSICVNGAEIHFDSATPVAIDGRRQPTESLQLGQMVTVTAQAHGADVYASRIAVVHAVVGPVQTVTRADSKIEILGQTLSLPPGTELLASLQIGDTLAVDGNRQPNGEILVTRIERVPTATNVSLMGPVTQAQGTRFSVQGLQVQLSATFRGAVPVAGQEVLVQGSLASGVLQADDVVLNPRFRFAGPVSQLDLQGYVRATAEVGVLNVDGARVAVDARTALPEGGRLPAAGARVHVFASVRPDGGFLAERVRIERPSRPEERQSTSATTRNETRQERGETGASEREAAVERSEAGGQRGGEVSRPDVSRPSIERPQIERPEVVRPDVM